MKILSIVLLSLVSITQAEANWAKVNCSDPQYFPNYSSIPGAFGLTGSSQTYNPYQFVVFDVWSQPIDSTTRYHRAYVEVHTSFPTGGGSLACFSESVVLPLSAPFVGSVCPPRTSGGDPFYCVNAVGGGILTGPAEWLRFQRRYGLGIFRPQGPATGTPNYPHP